MIHAIPIRDFIIKPTIRFGNDTPGLTYGQRLQRVIDSLIRCPEFSSAWRIDHFTNARRMLDAMMRSRIFEISAMEGHILFMMNPL